MERQIERLTATQIAKLITKELLFDGDEPSTKTAEAKLNYATQDVLAILHDHGVCLCQKLPMGYIYEVAETGEK